jgi:hypothetical protein
MSRITREQTPFDIGSLNLGKTDQLLTGGYNVQSAALPTGNVAMDCGLSPLQSIANDGAFTIRAPAQDGSCILQVINGSAAGAITFEDFTVGSNTGDALDTTSGHVFAIEIWSIGGIAGYFIHAQGSWSPAELPGVVGFWRADVGVSQSGGAVSAWADQSGAGANITQSTPANQPQWNATAFNGFPGVESTNISHGNEMYLQNDAFAFQAAEFSIFAAVIVSHQSGGWGPGHLIGVTANGAGDDHTNPSIAFQVGDDGGGGAVLIAQSTTVLGVSPRFTVEGGLGTPLMIGVTGNGSAASLFVDEPSPVGSNAFALSVGSNPNLLQIGGQFLGGTLSTLAWVVITSQAMTQADVTKLKNWSNRNFGTSF